MKKIAIVISTYIMWVVAKIYPYRLSTRLGICADILYTLWIRNFLSHLGHKSIISYPCCLQGGGQKLISIGDNTRIQSHSVLGCWVKYGNQHFKPTLNIGSGCRIGEYSHITACHRVEIGDGLLTGRFVYIGDNSHGGLSQEEAVIPPVYRILKSKGEIKIGNNVWIGDKTTILGGVHVGNNVIIGANSIVTKNLPDNCIAVGAPAKVIKILKA